MFRCSAALRRLIGGEAIALVEVAITAFGETTGT
jgi:hypothetical protein